MSELWQDQVLALQHLENAGHDLHVYAWQEQQDGSVKYQPLGTAFRTAQGKSSPIYLDKKRRRTLPLVEAKALAKFGPWLRFFCQSTKNLWSGVVTLNRPCSVNDVASRRAETFKAIRRFFEKSNANADLVFTIVHEPVCDYRGCNGELLMNVHAHFLFIGKMDRVELGRFEERFYRKFSVGSRVERVRHRGKYISYILRTPDLRPLLNAGEYVNWATGVNRHRRMIVYGSFRTKLARWRKQCKRIETRHVFDQKRKRFRERLYLADRPTATRCRSTRGLSFIPLNTIVGSTFINTKDGLRPAAIVKNPTGPA